MTTESRPAIGHPPPYGESGVVFSDRHVTILSRYPRPGFAVRFADPDL